MSPYQPGAVPAKRYVVFSDEFGFMYVYDETELQEEGATFTAEWQSSTLNRKNPMRLYTIEMLYLYYSYDGGVDTSIKVSFSGDGGKTWSSPVTVPILSSGNGVAVAPGGVTGGDLRYRIQFDQDPVVTITHFHPVLKEAGEVPVGNP